MLETPQKVAPTDKVIADDTRGQSAGNADIVWLSGFVDGEGCLNLNRKIQKGKWISFVPLFQVTNTHKPSIERIVKILSALGVGSHVINAQLTGNRKPYSCVRTDGMKRVKKLLELLAPFLFTKKEQAELLLEFISIRQSQPVRSPHGDREIKIYQRIKELNHRGSSETTRVPQITI